MPESPSFKLRDPMPPPAAVARCELGYAELDVISNFSFLRGASHPDELVYTAANLGYRAIALTDVCTLAGMVRAHAAAKECGMKLIVGSRLQFADGMPDILVWCMNRTGYGNLCKLLTIGKRRTEKGKCELGVGDLLGLHEGLLIAIDEKTISATTQARNLKPEIRINNEARMTNVEEHDPQKLVFRHSSFGFNSDFGFRVSDLRRVFADRIWLAVSLAYSGDDETDLSRMVSLSQSLRLSLLATNHVHYHDPARRSLQDVLVSVREKCTIGQAGYNLFPNAERYLKSPEQMHRLFAACPQALCAGVEIANRCSFVMSELKYEYPDELVPEGKSATTYLRDLAWAGAREKFGENGQENAEAPRHGKGRDSVQESEDNASSPCLRALAPSCLPIIPQKIRDLINYELKLIEQLKFEAYFLTVYDLVKFARSRGILCQGRGSAANSAVCYCLGITSVDPSKIDLLFERFISAERNEYPDIDIDFEHERREEVLQYLYNKYGRDRAGMAAVVITYRGRSAIRDVGKALGLSLDMVDTMAKKLDWWHRGVLNDAMVRETGLDPNDPNVKRVLSLASELLGFPRHLGQHVGGMVMTRGPLCEVVPIENAAMENRTVIEWDKDDIEELGILKVDCLGLGMLSCISKAFGMLERRDEATKRRSDEGGEQVVTLTLGDTVHGNRANIQRLDCLAKEHGTESTYLSSDREDARRRAIWVDESDATSGGFDSIQHCRRSCQTKSSGLHPVFEDCTGLTCRAYDAVRDCVLNENDFKRRNNDRFVGGGRSRTTGPDSKLRTEERIVTPESSSGRPISPPPLRRSVASSLRRSTSPLRCFSLHTIPPDDPAVYDMICNADTIGVFQIESRAQMSMLPRLRPRSFYDLVIEVAIVRPGPIQGNMVHPYLRRRNGEEPVVYPSEALKRVLHKTLGVPLFQEQAMRVAMVAAGFTAAEADQLRRAMAAWKKSTKLLHFQDRIIQGMLRNGYTHDFAQRTFEQIKGFGEYGFPESHSASFAILVYVSAWLKCHHPAVFAAALVNSQPMGFYQPAQIIRDARDHGVEVREVDVNFSEWDCTLEEGDEEGRHTDEATKRRSDEGTENLLTHRNGPAIRLGMRLVKGFREAFAQQVIAERFSHGPFKDIAQFQSRTRLPTQAIRSLAEADAFSSLKLSRREALWESLELTDKATPLLDELPSSLRRSVAPSLPIMPLGQEVMTDYATTSLSLKAHPLSLVRSVLTRQKIFTASELSQIKHGRFARVAGLVLIRQRPGTASGIVFITLEDETGVVNLIVRPNVYDQYRPAARHAALLQCDGYVERQGQVLHVMAKRLFDRSELIRGFELSSRDFH
ncbi:MAG TPA: PHP domain-containing protein [Tepidisphaeraceae bacterium]|nr:PHP domain-containing protein [Tepidisphaeraceae bacterium]